MVEPRKEKTIRVGSLFSGIGGMDAGLARAGCEHVFFCESDPWRREVLAARWPGVPVYPDVAELANQLADSRTDSPDAASREVGEPGRNGRPARPDLLCGGFPCQDLSVAGRRAGLDGDRSGLFFEFARIIDTLRPGWVLVENVPGLLSSNGGRDFGVVLGTLAELGYGVAWRILDSRFFGVPQRRRRVFILGAVADGDPRAAAERASQVLAVGSRCPGHPATSGEAGPGIAVAPANGARDGVAGSLTAMGGKNERGYRIGVEEASAGFVIPTLAPALTAAQAIGDPADQVAYVTSIALASDPISAENLAQPITGRNGDPGVLAGADVGVRRLTPRECERLQGLPDDWTRLDDKTPDSRRYSALGDAVTATVAEWIGHRLMESAMKTPGGVA